jgi:hypothetical protein
MARRVRYWIDIGIRTAQRLAMWHVGRYLITQRAWAGAGRDAAAHCGHGRGFRHGQRLWMRLTAVGATLAMCGLAARAQAQATAPAAPTAASAGATQVPNNTALANADANPGAGGSRVSVTAGAASRDRLASALPAGEHRHRDMLGRLVSARRRMAFLESPHIYRAAQGLMISTAGFDYVETAKGIASPSHLHLTINSSGSPQTMVLDFSNSFAEGGWTRFIGPHNTVGVIALNAGVDALLAFAAHRLAQRGPRWRMLATGILVVRALEHISGGRSWIGLSGRIAAPYAPYDPFWQH